MGIGITNITLYLNSLLNYGKIKVNFFKENGKRTKFSISSLKILIIRHNIYKK